MSVRKEIHELLERRFYIQEGNGELCCHMRICRNLQGYAFPVKASRADRQKISLMIQDALAQLAGPKQKLTIIPWSTCSDEERRFLKRLYHLEAPCEETAIVYGKKFRDSFIINDGDALRLDGIISLRMMWAIWKSLNKLENQLQDYLPFAFDPERGYATVSPSCYGTGVDVRAHVHLPALCFKQKLVQLQEALKVMHLKMDAVEVLGDKILGHQFFITPTTTQGCSEEEALDHLITTVEEVVKREKRVRDYLWRNDRNFMKDSISRAIGVLKSCYELTFEEGMNLISVVLMGMDMGIVPHEGKLDLASLWGLMPIEFLAECCKGAFDPNYENKIRAEAVRAYFLAYNIDVINNDAYDDEDEEEDYVS